MPELPTGTVTFLMTDVEGSTARWEAHQAEMLAAMATHDELVSEVIEAHSGVVVKHLGDGFWGAFPSATAAVLAAVEIQSGLQRGAWVHGDRLRVRMGLHTGIVEPSDGDYFGPVPNRASRIVALANGDQIVCSAATAHLLEGVRVRSEGHHELRGIGQEELFLVLDDRMRVDPNPLRRAIAPSKLPLTRTSFVGRDGDVAAVERFLADDHTVVTLVGPGGVGKTRLAAEVGALMRDRFVAGVCFCDLSAVAEPAAVVEAMAAAIGARRQPGMDLLDSISDFLFERETLLILDNCEHVVAEVGELVGRLSDVNTLRILATSREPLHLMGEQVVVVKPLEPESDGADLFIQRVRGRLADYDPTGSEIDRLRALVRRIDGIPLAIELAAAWAGVLTPDTLMARLADDADVLRDGHRVARHVTLRDTVAWSYDLLQPPEAALFRRMTVFAGGASLTAIESVCGDDRVPEGEVARLVLSLVDKSMVVSSPEPDGRRFTLLETLRSFGREQLEAEGVAATIERRHADFFREFAADQERRLFSPAETDVWWNLDREWPNLRAALDTFEREGDLGAGAELVTSLVWFAAISMRFELFTWANELLELPSIESEPAFVDLCGAAALGAYFTVDRRVTELAERGLAASSLDPKGFCRTALAAVFLNNLHEATTSDALTSAWLASSPSDVGSRMWAEAFRTFHLCLHDPSPQAAVHAAATTRIAHATGSVTAHALAAWAEGQVVAIDDIDRAIEVWTDGLEWPRSMPGDHLVEPLLTGLILHFAVGRGDVTDALHRCRDALRRALDAHYLVGASHLLGVTAIALCRAGDADTGARLVGAMIGNGHIPRSNARRALEAALGTDVLDPFFAPGMQWSVTRAVHVGLEALETAIIRQAPAIDA